MGNAGISQLYVGAGIPDAVHLHGDVQLYCGGIVQVDPIQPAADPLARDDPGGGLHRLGVPSQTGLITVPADAPGTIAAHLTHTAVGIVKAHFVVAALGGGVYHHQSVCADGKMPFTKSFCDLGQKLHRQMLFQIVQHDKIISGAVHFPEFQKDTSSQWENPH